MKLPLKRLLTALITATVAISLLSHLYHASGCQAKRRLRHMETLLEEKSGTPRLGLPKTYHIASLSFLSEGLVHYSRRYPGERKRVEDLFQMIIASALDQRNGNVPIRNSSRWGEENLLISHVGVILLSYEKSTGNTQLGDLLDEIVAHLRSKLKKSKLMNIRSYNRSTSVWPADNALMYQLICDYDRLRGNAEDSTLVKSWFIFMEQNGSDSTGLHISELTENESYSPVPRGCALSWTAAYMAHCSPVEAKQFWKNYKREMKVPLLFWAGFREYPRGRACAEDGDSGPIIFGIGGGATGLALTGAGANGDLITFNQLNNTMNLIEIAAAAAKLFGKPEFDQMVNGLLPSSIKFKGEMLMLQ